MMQTFREFLEQKYPYADKEEVRSKYKEFQGMSLMALEWIGRRMGTDISTSELYGDTDDVEDKQDTLIDNIMAQLYGDDWQLKSH